MPIQFQCRCGKQYQVKDSLAGRITQCPSCQAKIRVPEKRDDSTAVSRPQNTVSKTPQSWQPHDRAERSLVAPRGEQMAAAVSPTGQEPAPVCDTCGDRLVPVSINGKQSRRTCCRRCVAEAMACPVCGSEIPASDVQQCPMCSCSWRQMEDFGDDSSSADDITTTANYTGPMPSRVKVADGFYWLDNYRLLPKTQYIMLPDDYKFPELCAGCFRADKTRPVYREIEFRFDSSPFSLSVRFYACGKCQSVVRNMELEHKRKGRTAEQGFRDFPLRFLGLRAHSKPGLALIDPEDRLIAFQFPSVDYAVQFLALNDLWAEKCAYIQGHSDPWHGKSEHWVAINHGMNKNIFALRKEGIANRDRSHFGSKDDTGAVPMTFELSCKRCGARSAFDAESLAEAGDAISCTQCVRPIEF